MVLYIRIDYSDSGFIPGDKRLIMKLDIFSKNYQCLYCINWERHLKSFDCYVPNSSGNDKRIGCKSFKRE